MAENAEDKIIWITGASRGIGAAISRRMALAKSKLALTASTQQSFRDIVNDFTVDDQFEIFPADITDAEDVIKAYKEIKKWYGVPDILINNAGTGNFKPFNEFILKEIDEQMKVNFYGTFLCTKAVINDMIQRGSGIIINILSVAALKPFKFSAGYAASKMAVLGMSRSLREEVRDKNIKVIDIFPGATETGIWSEEQLDEFKNRMIQPYDIAEIIHDIINNSLNNRTIIEEMIIRPQKGDL